MKNELALLLDTLPNSISSRIGGLEELVEIVVDLGRPVELRYYDNEFAELPVIVTDDLLSETLSHLGQFGPDDRVGIPGTLHRVSRVPNRRGEPVGLTFRVGRDVCSNIKLIADLVDTEENILFIGPPGVGKTSLIRSAAKYLSETAEKRVVVIDASNEIAGEGNIPHPAIGRARRVQVPVGKTQSDMMIQAVENMMPEIIIVDEISNFNESIAAKTIANRGVQIIATVHGKTISDLIENPPLNILIGGIETVTLSDETARSRGTFLKTVQERKFNPVFNIIAELISFNDVVVHKDVRDVVTAHLAGGYFRGEQRRVMGTELQIVSTAKVSLPSPVVEELATSNGRKKK